MSRNIFISSFRCAIYLVQNKPVQHYLMLNYLMLNITYLVQHYLMLVYGIQ